MVNISSDIFFSHYFKVLADDIIQSFHFIFWSKISIQEKPRVCHNIKYSSKEVSYVFVAMRRFNINN